MRGLFVVICMIVLTVLAVTTPQTSRAAVSPSYPFVVEFEPSSALSMDEPITMTLRIKPRTSILQIMSGDDCGDTVAIELIGDRGLQALGANAMTGTFGADSTYTTSFDVILPPDDTSSITVWLRSPVRKMEVQRWFVTTADTVEYWHGNPREYLYSARPRSEYEPPKHKLNERTELPDSTYRGSLVPAPPVKERQLAEMRQLEKEPLTDYTHQAVGQDRQPFYPGRAVIEADSNLISLPYNIKGIVFDTLHDIGDSQNLPKWSFLGPLRVDSLITRQGRVPLERQSQLKGITLGPAELLSVFSDIRVRTFFKSYPDRVPADTLFWDSVREQWHILPDMSRFYRILFPENYPLDSAMYRLRTVPGVGVGRVGIPAQ
ncbi:MAG: hypothetical protein KAW61_08670 [candidate division Zixibacteria bacterium]|nr:hypothetical protein [candidate division Zixibacteria bacterium]